MRDAGGDQGVLERFRVEMDRAQARQRGGLDFILWPVRHAARPPRRWC